MTKPKKAIRNEYGKIIGFASLTDVTRYLHSAGFSHNHQKTHRDSKKGFIKKLGGDGDYYRLEDVQDYARAFLFESHFSRDKKEPAWITKRPAYGGTPEAALKKTAIELNEEKLRHDVDIKKYTAKAKRLEYEALQKKYILREDHEKNMAAAMSVMINGFNAMVKTKSGALISFVDGNVDKKQEFEDMLLRSMDEYINRMLDQAFSVEL